VLYGEQVAILSVVERRNMAKVPPKVQAKTRVVLDTQSVKATRPVFQPLPDDGRMDSSQSDGEVEECFTRDEVMSQCNECMGSGKECGSSDGVCPCMCHISMFELRQCESCDFMSEILAKIGMVLKNKKLSQTDKLRCIKKYL